MKIKKPGKPGKILLQKWFQSKGVDTKYSIHLENIVARSEVTFFVWQMWKIILLIEKNSIVTLPSKMFGTGNMFMKQSAYVPEGRN